MATDHDSGAPAAPLAPRTLSVGEIQNPETLAAVSDRWPQGRMLVEAAAASPDPALYQRIRILRGDFKYPLIRVEETFRRDAQTGPDVLIQQTAMVADHVLVTLASGADESAFQATVIAAGGTIRARKPASKAYLITVPAPLAINGLPDAIDALKASATVRVAEPDFIVHASLLPNDPSVAQLYGLHNTGQTGGVADADIDAPEAWEVTTGSRAVRVGVIDTGIDYTHPDLAANMWTNSAEIAGNGVDDDGNGYIDDVRGWDFVNNDADPMDDHYHGTHCAGTIGGVGNNGAGVAGVSWQVSLVGLKFLSASGSGTTSDAVEAVSYANGLGLDLTSNSWGGGGFSQALYDAIAAANTAGRLFIAAAGNSARNTDASPNYPSGYDLPNIVAVAATDHADQLASFSNYGAASVDLAAPGVNTVSTAPGPTYRTLSGTSMATPHVAGAAALLLSRQPGLAGPELKAALLNSVDLVPALSGRVLTQGRLNVASALSSLSGLGISPATGWTVSAQIGGALPATSTTFTLRNGGSAPLSWTTASGVPWADMSAASGTLAPGATASVVVSLDATAAVQLPHGAYEGVITFTNISDGAVLRRNVRLILEPLTVSVFSETFEAASLDSARWTITGGANARAVVSTADLPHGGARHLVMDAVTNGTYARNEATLRLDLAGRSDLRLTFWAKGFGDEPDGPPSSPFLNGADFDGVAISADGVTWYEIQALRTLSADWQKYTVDLDAALAARGLAYNSEFRIRFNQYDNFAVPTDGIAIDDISIVRIINKRLGLVSPATLPEGGVGTATLTAAPPPDAELVVALADVSSALVLPATVTLAPGQGSIDFAVSAPEDTLRNGTRSPVIRATSPGWGAAEVVTRVLDNETATLGLDLPASATEGSTALAGTVTVSPAPDADVTVELSSDDTGELRVPATTIISAGQTSATFELLVVDDNRIDGTTHPAITARIDNWTPASAALAIHDNEARALFVSAPASVHEGVASLAATVTLSGTLAAPLAVTLATDDATELTPPAEVIIPAGQLSATATVVIVNDTIQDGPQTVRLIASAPSFATGEASLIVKDNDAHHLRLSDAPSAVLRNQAVAFVLSGEDIADQLVPDYSSALSLAAMDSTGVPVPLSPASVASSAFVSGRWSGSIGFGAYATGVRITISDTAGRSVTSAPFDVIAGAAASFVWDNPPATVTVDTPFVATVRALDGAGNPAASFAGDVSLSVQDNASGSVRVLSWIGYADTTPAGEYENTKRAIRNHFTAFTETSTTLTDASALAAALVDKDVFLVPEQETDFSNNIVLLAAAWAPVLQDFVTRGGTVIVCSMARQEHRILQSGNLLTASKAYTSPGSHPVAKTGSTWLNEGVATSFTAFSVSTYAGSNGQPAIASQIFPYYLALSRNVGAGRAVLIGTDYAMIGSDMDRIIANAVRTSRAGDFSMRAPVRPTSVVFANGVWSGPLSVPIQGASLSLRADTADGLKGVSTAFSSVAYVPPSGGGLVITAPVGVAETAGSVTATVSRAAASASPLEIALTSGSPAEITVPASVTIPSDATSVQFSFTVNDDTLIDGDRDVVLAATAAGSLAGSATVRVLDDETGVLTLTAPATVVENAAATTATLVVNPPAARSLTVALSSSNLSAATVPALVVIPAGYSSFTFPITPINDTAIDGDQTTLITATLAGWPAATRSIIVTDNEQRTLTLAGATSVEEGDAATVTVGVGGTLATDLVVNLSSADSAQLTTPATVTIPAGQTSASFQVQAIEDAAQNGGRTIKISAAADTFAGATRDIVVRDDELHHFVFGAIPDGRSTHVPIAVTLTAFASDNVAITSYTGAVALSAQAANGDPITISPVAAGAFVNGVWTGDITAANTGVGARVTATAGSATGQSNAFDILGAPRVAVAPASISVELHRDESTTRDVVISNSGQLPLTWSASGIDATAAGSFAEPVVGPSFDGGPARPKDADTAAESALYEAPRVAGPSVSAPWASRLETVLSTLDAGHAAIRALIPGRYAFTDGVTGTNISDGGGDMYDGGNYLSTDLGSSLSYSDGVILSSAALGAGGRYFTRKYDGLFVFAADLAGVSHFEITGNLGADGSGSTDTAILSQTRGGVTYRGFVKRVYGAGDPSVNHLVIVADNGSVTHAASTDTNSDQHRVSGLSGVTRIYHLLYAGGSGGYIDNASAQAVMSAFLDVVSRGDWMSAAPASGTIAPGASVTVTLTFDSTALEFRTHVQTLRIASNDPLQPATEIPVSLTVTDRVLHRFEFDAIPAQIRGAPFTVRLRALASDGLPVFLHAAPVALSANGATLTPSTTTAQGWVEGVWTGQATVTTFGTGITLSAGDGAGHAGLSNAFDVGTGPAAGFRWDTIPSPQVVDTPFPAVLRAIDAGGNPAIAYSGAVALSAIIPQTLAKTGADYSTDYYPFAAPYGAVARQQALYPAATLGGRPRRLVSLALNVTTASATASFSQWTIRLKHSTRTTLSGAPFDANGWTTVHVSTATPAATGWVTFGFTSPFDYNGTDALLVDFSFRNSTTNSTYVSTAVSYDGSAIRSIKQTSSSAAADPFAFTSASSFSYYSPIIRFSSLEATPLRPSGATLTNGVWSGDVSVAAAGAPIQLRASAPASAFSGDSNAFTVSSPAIPILLPFTETWESGTLAPAWTLGGTSSHRNQITTDNAPHGGARHLTLDSTSSTPFSRNEATLTLDLAGRTGVVLSFWAKGFNEGVNAPATNPFTGGADFDGVAISADGVTWHEIQPLRSPALTNAWQLFTVNLDDAISARGLAYTSAFRIRFNRYGNDYIPYDGIAIDDISVTTSATGVPTLALPTAAVESAAPVSGTLSLTVSRPTDTVFTLSSTSPAKLSLPGTITLPAGQTSVSFAATPIDDMIFDGSRAVVVTAAPPSGSGLFKGIATIVITDDDAPAIALSVTPSSVAENASAATATATLGATPAASISLALASSDPSAASVPPSVVFEPGQTTATFLVTPVNDTKIDGPQTTMLSASLAGTSPGTASFTVTDNETTNLGLSISSSIQEGSSGSGTVSISGTLPDPLVVSLSSANPAQLTVPATVTIPAGSTSASFTATAVDDADTDGSKYVQITVAAPGFTSATATPRATDNDLHHFSFSTVSTGQVANRSFTVYAYARTIDEDGIPAISRNVSLSAQNAGGAVPVSPASLTFSSGSVTASITVQAPATGVTLRLDDGAGHTGSSNSFDVGVGSVVKFGVSSLSPYVAVGVPAAVTITALDGYGNRVPTYAGAADLLAVPFVSTTGFGVSSTANYPAASNYTTSRTQILYTPAEAGPAGRLSSLGLRFLTMPGQAMDNFTIRLKHASATLPTGWQPDGWTTVYQGSVNLVGATPGWVQFPFSTPFDYDGSSHLMVDLTFRNSGAGYTQNGVVETTNVAAYRVRYHATYESYGYGSPLLWSGSAPYNNTEDDLPNLQLTRSGVAVPVAPAATGAFTAGAWTGNVTFGAASAEPIALHARQGALFGQSGSFTVVDFPAPALLPEPPVTGGTGNTLSWTPVPDAVGYETQAGAAADFTAPATSDWIGSVSHTFAPLAEGPWSYRVRARMPLFNFGEWRQSETAEFASDQLDQVDATIASGEVRLVRQPYVYETFDQASAWSGTAFPDVSAGTFTLSALTSAQGPNTTPPLPINQGGDKEALIAGASASALTAGAPILNGAIETYLRPGLSGSTSRLGVLLRASRANGQLNGYMASFLMFGGNFQVDVHRIVNGVRTWIGGYSSLYYYTSGEHYRLRFSADADTLQIQFWKVAVVNGVVTEALIKHGSSDQLTLSDGYLAAPGQFGLYAEDSGAGALFEDVKITTPEQNNYVAAGTLVSTPITPDPFLGWGRFSNDSGSPAGTSISFDVLDADSRLLAPNIPTQTKLSDIPAVASAPTIRLRARFATTVPASTPILRAWGVDWRREISGHLNSPWSAAVASIQDATAPSIAITSAPVSSTASYVLAGTATDANGVATLTVGGHSASTADAFATWSRAVTLHPGVNVLSLLAADPADPANVRSTTFNVAYTPPDIDFDGLPDPWEIAHGLDSEAAGADYGRLGDPDRDGIPNLLEYAMGLDPKAAEARSPVASAIETHPDSGQRHLVFVYRRLIHPGSLTYAVTLSSNLVTWSSPATAPEVLSVVANPDGLTETVTLRIHPALGAGRVFVRVQVDIP